MSYKYPKFISGVVAHLVAHELRVTKGYKYKLFVESDSESNRAHVIV